MTTRHLVDPEIAPLMDQFSELRYTWETLPRIRAGIAEISTQLHAHPDIDVAEHHVPGPQGAPDVRVLVYLPKHRPRPLPALLWIHGGGYVIGNADMDDD